jgi:hypothetical protein
LPTTYNEGLALFKSLPELLKETKRGDGVYGIAKKVYLYPLSKLSCESNIITRMISDPVVTNAQSMLEGMRDTLVTVNDLEREDIAKKFRYIGEQLKEFKTLVEQKYRASIHTLAYLLPQVRGYSVKLSTP